MSWNVKERIAEALDEGRKGIDAEFPFGSIDNMKAYDEMSSCILTTLGMFEDLIEAREKDRMRFGRET